MSDLESQSPPLDHSTDEPLRLVTLCRLRVVEADLAKAKLESEGIECIIRDSRFAIAEPLLLTDVPILVRDTDLERAREILSRPAPDDAEGEYVDEPWRCPKCHRRGIDLLPLTGGWKWIRNGCLMLVALPMVLGVVRWVEGNSSLGRWIEEASSSYFPLWMLVVGGLGVAVILAKRKKKCRDCGHEWTTGAS